MRLPWDRESRVRAGARRPAPPVALPSLGSRGSEAPGPSRVSNPRPPPPAGLRKSPRSRSLAGGYDGAAEEYAACPRVTWHPPSYILGKQDGEEWAFCGQGGGWQTQGAAPVGSYLSKHAWEIYDRPIFLRPEEHMEKAGNPVKEHAEKVAICKLRKKASLETNPAKTLILDFRPPETSTIFFCFEVGVGGRRDEQRKRERENLKQMPHPEQSPIRVLRS
ncbi:unnamed protein product [Nyctereutes procyonoides]|uniref:(raccoon dog) hypothetical protein n=1 Tax=Nyctereutes procyonoides TaxID=34880 RepID=A0A811YNJ0_NYCPR|nr:unnamed protein product [Nyctereutes procyonoides]